MGWTQAGCPDDLRWQGMGRCHQDFAGLGNKGVRHQSSFWRCSCLQVHGCILSKTCFQQVPLNHRLVLREFGGTNYYVCSHFPQGPRAPC